VTVTTSGYKSAPVTPHGHPFAAKWTTVQRVAAQAAMGESALLVSQVSCCRWAPEGQHIAHVTGTGSLLLLKSFRVAWTQVPIVELGTA
jgi:hypothetical protein